MIRLFSLSSPAYADQCRSDDAMILFSIFDHDVITSNDFGGEAFFALKNVPGVQVGSLSCYVLLLSIFSLLLCVIQSLITMQLTLLLRCLPDKNSPERLVTIVKRKQEH